MVKLESGTEEPQSSKMGTLLELREGVTVRTFTKGKTEDRNEDFFGCTDNAFVIADGATDKSGKKYEGKTGGELASRLVVQESLTSELTGTNLVNYLNGKIAELYGQLGIIENTSDPKYRFSCGFISVKITGDKILVTYLGDAGFRINGKNLYREVKQVDIDNSEERARFIEQTGDIPGSRDHIMPRLLKQFDYQNQNNEPLGYGVLDGTQTPPKFVKTFEYPKADVKTIELFSDGYFAVPEETDIVAWEKLHEQVEQEDPDKWKRYKSTKQKDDRTIAIISLENK